LDDELGVPIKTMSLGPMEAWQIVFSVDVDDVFRKIYRENYYLQEVEVELSKLGLLTLRYPVLSTDVDT
jgi:hypothetical protein